MTTLAVTRRPGRPGDPDWQMQCVQCTPGLAVAANWVPLMWAPALPPAWAETQAGSPGAMGSAATAAARVRRSGVGSAIRVLSHPDRIIPILDSHGIIVPRWHWQLQPPASLEALAPLHPSCCLLRSSRTSGCSSSASLNLPLLPLLADLQSQPISGAGAVAKNSAKADSTHLQ